MLPIKRSGAFFLFSSVPSLCIFCGHKIFVCINKPTDLRIVITALEVVERGMIVERTQTGKAVARQNPNFREGRPKKYTAIQLQHATDLLNAGNSYKQVEAMTGISKSTLIRARNQS